MYQFSQKTCLATIGLWLLICLFSMPLAAQQLSIFNQYRDLLTIINPGAIPIDYFVYDFDDDEPTFFAGATWRDQWRGGEFEGAPSTKIIRTDYFAKDIGLGGIFAGAYLIQDSHSIFKTTGIYGKIASVIGLRTGELSLGLTMGVVRNRLESSPIGVRDEFSGRFLDVGFGIFYKYDFPESGFFYTGFSVPQLNGGRTPLEIDNQDLSFERKQHYYYTFGFSHYFLDDSFFEPSIWVKYVPNVPLDIDLNIRFQLVDLLSLGIGLSVPTKSFHLNAAFLHKLDSMFVKFGFGYTGSWATYSSLLGNTYEYNLNYIF